MEFSELSNVDINDRFYSFQISEEIREISAKNGQEVNAANLYFINKPRNNFGFNQYVEYYLTICDRFSNWKEVASRVIDLLAQSFSTEFYIYEEKNLIALGRIIFAHNIDTPSGIEILTYLSRRQVLLEIYLDDFIDLIVHLTEKQYWENAPNYNLLTNCLGYIAEMEIPLYDLLGTKINLGNIIINVPTSKQRKVSYYLIIVYLRKIFYVTYISYYPDFDNAPKHFYRMIRSFSKATEHFNFKTCFEERTLMKSYGMDLTLSPYIMLTFPSILWGRINGQTIELNDLDKEFIHPIEDVDNFILLKKLLEKFRDVDCNKFVDALTIVREYICMLSIEGKKKVLSIILETFKKTSRIPTDISSLILECIRLKEVEIEKRIFHIPFDLLHKLISLLPKMLESPTNPVCFNLIIYNLIIVQVEQTDELNITKMIKLNEMSAKSLDAKSANLCRFIFECLLHTKPKDPFVNVGLKKIMETVRTLKRVNYSMEEEKMICCCIDSLKITFNEKKNLLGISFDLHNKQGRAKFFSSCKFRHRWIVSVRYLMMNKPESSSCYDYYYNIVDFEKRVIQQCQQILKERQDETTLCSKEYLNEILMVLLSNKSDYFPFENFSRNFKYLSEINNGHYLDLMDHTTLSPLHFPKLASSDWQTINLILQWHSRLDSIKDIFPTLSISSKFVVCRNIMKHPLFSSKNEMEKDHLFIIKETVKECSKKGYLHEKKLWQLIKSQPKTHANRLFGFLRTLTKYLNSKELVLFEEQTFFTYIISILGVNYQKYGTNNRFNGSVLKLFLNFLSDSHMFQIPFLNVMKLLDHFSWGYLVKWMNHKPSVNRHMRNVFHHAVHKKQIINSFYENASEEMKFYQKIFHNTLVNHRNDNEHHMVLYLMSWQNKCSIGNIHDKIFDLSSTDFYDYFSKEYLSIVFIVLESKLNNIARMHDFIFCRKILLSLSITVSHSKKNYKYHLIRLYLFLFKLTIKFQLLRHTINDEQSINNRIINGTILEIFQKCPIVFKRIPISAYFILAKFQVLDIVKSATQLPNKEITIGVGEFDLNEKDKFQKKYNSDKIDENCEGIDREFDLNDDCEKNDEKILVAFYFQSRPLNNLKEFLFLCNIIEERFLLYNICYLSKWELKCLMEFTENDLFCQERLYRLYNQLFLMKTMNKKQVWANSEIDALENYIHTFICKLVFNEIQPMNERKMLGSNPFDMMKKCDVKNRMMFYDLVIEDIELDTKFINTEFTQHPLCLIVNEYCGRLTERKNLNKLFSLTYLIGCIRSSCLDGKEEIFFNFLGELNAFFRTIQPIDRRFLTWFYYEIRDIFDQIIFKISPNNFLKFNEVFIQIASSFSDNIYVVELFQFIIHRYTVDEELNTCGKTKCHPLFPVSIQCNLSKWMSYDFYIRSLFMKDHLNSLMNLYKKINSSYLESVLMKFKYESWDSVAGDLIEKQLGNWSLQLKGIEDEKKNRNEIRDKSFICWNKLQHVNDRSTFRLGYDGSKNSTMNRLDERLKKVLLEKWKQIGRISLIPLDNYYMDPLNNIYTPMNNINFESEILEDYNLKEVLKRRKRVILGKWRYAAECRKKSLGKSSLQNLMLQNFLQDAPATPQLFNVQQQIIRELDQYSMKEKVLATRWFIAKYMMDTSTNWTLMEQTDNIISNIVTETMKLDMKEIPGYCEFYENLSVYYSVVYENAVKNHQNFHKPNQIFFDETLSLYPNVIVSSGGLKIVNYAINYIQVTMKYLQYHSSTSNMEPGIILNFISILLANGMKKEIEDILENELKQINPNHFQMISRHIFVQFKNLVKRTKFRKLSNSFFEIISKLLDDPTSEIYSFICLTLINRSPSENRKRSIHPSSSIPLKFSKMEENSSISLNSSTQDLLNDPEKDMEDISNNQYVNNGFLNMINELPDSQRKNLKNVLYLETFLTKCLKSQITDDETYKNLLIPLSSKYDVRIDKYEIPLPSDKTKMIINFFGSDGNRYDRKLTLDSTKRNDFLMYPLMEISRKIIDLKRSYLTIPVERIMMINYQYILTIHQPRICLQNYLYDCSKKLFPDDLQPSQCYKMFKNNKNRLRTLMEILHKTRPLLFHFYFEYCSSVNEVHHARKNFIRSTAINNFFMKLFHIKSQLLKNIYINPHNGQMICDSFYDILQLRKDEKKWGDIPIRLTRNIRAAFGSTDMIGHYNQFFHQLNNIFARQSTTLSIMSFMISVEDDTIFPHLNYQLEDNEVLYCKTILKYKGAKIVPINTTEQLTEKATDIVELSKMHSLWMPYL
ncbi:hypothetical protein SNEBB_000030 [Seison nebaliae]|nr:hypothetical protein SNEBB_000030 [Seison nebaliae]